MLVSADFENLLEYFENWAENDPDLKFFLDGGVELGIDYATGHPEFEYPFAWLEQPEIETIDNGGGQLIERYVIGVAVIQKAKIDDREAQRQASIDTLRIIYRLQKKLRADNKKKSRPIGEESVFPFVDINLSLMKKMEVDRGWANNHRGWRLAMVLDMNANAILV